jgi:hypothetical protein
MTLSFSEKDILMVVVGVSRAEIAQAEAQA